MLPLELVRLKALMELTSGSPEVKIGLIDGPVATKHPDLADAHLSDITGSSGSTCMQTNSFACRHGTFVAGILSAKRDSPAPAICPSCQLLVRPIFVEATSGGDDIPVAKPRELVAAILDCIDARARVINLSVALAQPSTKEEHELDEALSQAARCGVIVVAAAGNQGTLGSSAITRHPWVLPVAACDLGGRPLNESNLGSSIGRRGLTAPGDGITSLGSAGDTWTLGGTSVSAPFVTGAIALLWSEFLGAAAAQIKLAITQIHAVRRISVVPPLLDAALAHQTLLTSNRERQAP